MGNLVPRSTTTPPRITTVSGNTGTGDSQSTRLAIIVAICVVGCVAILVPGTKQGALVKLTFEQWSAALFCVESSVRT